MSTYEILRRGGIEDARFEARQIDAVAEDAKKRQEMCKRRLAGEPLQYILGEWEFYSLPFYTGKGVLIPRPDTETLCDYAIELLGQRPADVIDLCAGSGAISVTVAKHCPNARVWAVEKSPEAFDYLKRNIKRNGASVTPILGDITAESFGEYDLILSNPPYIKSGEIPHLQKEVGYEPAMALDGGEDGLFFYREILKNWLPRLKKGGALAVEIGFDQAEEVKKLFADAGLSEVGSKKDLAGVERVIFGTLLGL